MRAARAYSPSRTRLGNRDGSIGPYLHVRRPLSSVRPLKNWLRNGAVAVEAVIWDFGGVFTTSPFEAFNRMEAERGLPKDLVRRVNSTNPDSNAWALFERNEIDAARFDTLFLEESTALGHPLRGADVLPLLNGQLRPRMVAALQACKQRFKVGCITNNVVSMHSPGQDTTQRSAGAMAQVVPLFDAIIESSKAGVRKPDPKIYLMMCDLLALMADKLDHHPEWFNVYNRVDVLLATHDVDGVSELDVKMAAFMDEAAKA